jgi:S1-C subfamily serine protease
MADETQKSGIWTQLSKSFSGAIEAVQDGVVAIHSGGRSTSSGVVWRPGIVVTTHHGLGQREGIKLNHAGDSLDASLIDGDPATDLAVLRISSKNLRPVKSTSNTYAGEVVLSHRSTHPSRRSAICGSVWQRTGQ